MVLENHIKCLIEFVVGNAKDYIIIIYNKIWVGGYKNKICLLALIFNLIMML